ncbi:MAG: rRNA maturation RNase YbeY [Myxococcales bacterium]|nr:rRNA maturation RNase YbeY [Myxococcales bacterium]
MAVRVAVRAEARGALSRAELGRLARRATRMTLAAALTDPTLGPPHTVEAGLTLAGDREVHELNRRYRRKNRPTDVLAFALREAHGARLTAGLLGDVIISVDTARRQAQSTLYDEVLFLWSHGLCHLLGYDHRTDRQEREMNARMSALRAEAERRGAVRLA